MIRFFLKHYYLFILFIVLLPAVITSVTQAVQEKNPTIPIVMLGTTFANADANIYKDVQVLKENPEQLIGMAKPDKGIVRHFIYYWKVFLVSFRLLGWIWAIAFPFVIFYKIFRIQGSKGFQSSKAADFAKAVIWGLVFVFIVNLIMIVTGFLDGTIISSFPEDATQFTRTWLVVLQSLPFHGAASLIKYLIGFYVVT